MRSRSECVRAHHVRPLPALPALLLLVLVPTLSGCFDGPRVGAEEVQRSAGAGEVPERLLVVTVVGDDAGGAPAELEEAVRAGGFFRWRLPEMEGWRAEVRRGTGAAYAPGADAEILVGLLPLPGPVRRLARDLPVDLAASHPTLAGTAYRAPSTTMVLRLPGAGEGPEERWLVAGARPEPVGHAVSFALHRAVERIAAAGGLVDGAEPGPDYAVRENRWLARTGRWMRRGGRWVPDPNAEEDELAARTDRMRGLDVLATDRVRLLAPPERVAEEAESGGRRAGLTADLHALDRAVAEVLPSLGVRAAGLDLPISVVAEDGYVSQARHTGAIGPAVPGGPADLHAVLHPQDAWAVRHAVARHLLERAGLAEGRPVWAVEGAALWLSGDWYGRGYRDWLPDLAAAGALPRASELLAVERTGSDSAPLWTPVAAAVVEGLPGKTAAEKLAAFDQAAVATRLAELEELASEAPPPLRAAPLPDGFLDGVSFAMLNRLEGGYHAPSIEPRLDRLRALGAGSISLMPFAYQGDPRRPEMRFLNGSPTSETDVGVIHAARAAHARGLSVLWKPHIWVSHGSWPGEIEMTSDEDWAQWWRTYRRYVLHHALLARYAGAEMLAVGVELERTVERRDDWLALIAAVRHLYPGPLTYAANWGRGAEAATFWDRLDAVGVDAYYPLAEVGAGEAEGVEEEELAAGARRAVERLGELARRTGKPVILTEVGFAARQAAWATPHEEGGELSETDQARAYGALLSALEGREWLRGVYVWKAFSGDVSSREGRPDFRFLGRPAEEVVAEFFRATPEGDGGAARRVRTPQSR